MNNYKSVLSSRVSRRRFLSGLGAGVGVSAAVSLAAGCGSSNPNPLATTTTPAPTETADTDILNFALNLEYLEASYYLMGTTGTGLSATDTSSSLGTAGTVTGGSIVPFTTGSLTQQYALEIANDELQHVRFLRSALGSLAVPLPSIDLATSFNTAATAAGITGGFNPFASEADFILGAFIFEDVGVTAYNGAGPLLAVKSNLAAAGSIVAVEAYHSGLIRTLLVYLDDGTATGTVALANKISALRAAASLAASGDNAAETPLAANAIVSAGANSIGYSRTTDQVLHIVYLNATAGATTKGGFFPDGLQGKITASAS